MKWAELRKKIQSMLQDSKSGYGKYEFNDALSLLIRERFIARAAQSTFKDSIVLKGGLLLTMIYAKSTRYTGDADIGLKNAYELGDYQKAVDSILAVDLKDGFSYSRNKGEILTNAQREYDGAQFNIDCRFDGKPRTKFILDIGVGDAVDPVAGKLPTLLDFDVSSIEMQVYPSETIAAEKLHAVVKFGARNTRFKDFYDLYILREIVDQKKFLTAAKKTFSRRKTAFPGEIPSAPDVLAVMQPQWTSFLRSRQYKVIKTVPKDFKTIVDAIKKYYG